MDDLRGQIIQGYAFQEQIGKGGYGVVYLGFDLEHRLNVAIKALLKERVQDKEAMQRLELEAQIIAQLEHPHIVPLYEYWVKDKRAFLVMQYLSGGNLRAILKEEGAWSLERTVTLLEQIVSALEAAHKASIVHRDLKPENILFDENGKAYLVDFGLAKRTNTFSNITGPDSVIGSPAYLTPEQLVSQPVSPQTDIYTLGVILYEVVTGQYPFKAGHMQLMMKHLNDPLPDIRIANFRLPSAVNEVIQRATAKKPDDRFDSASDLLAAFKVAIGQGNNHVPTPASDANPSQLS